MATVVNKITFQVIPLENTPDYPEASWLVNPTLPNCEKKYWKLVGETLEEMTQGEKDEVDYSTASTIYLIAEKQLITEKNGHDYEANSNAIINPSMPPGVPLHHTKVVLGEVVEMTAIEKNIIDHPAPGIEPIRRDLNNIPNILKLRSDSNILIAQI